MTSPDFSDLVYKSGQMKFNSPNAYNAYIDNYNYLITNNQNLIQITDKLSKINDNLSIFQDKNIKLLDNYLITDAYETIINDIKSPYHNDLLKSSIMSEIQHKKMNLLNNQINSLQSVKKIDEPTELKALKNYSNSRILNIEKRRNYPDDKVGPEKYIIYANGGCVSYDSQTDGPSPYTNGNEYKRISFQQCNAKDNKQLFVMDNMPTVSDYYNVKPLNNPDNMCLHFDDSGLSVQPCDGSIYQKYSGINQHVLSK